MSDLREAIINEIKKVYDPEVPVNIWDLGLIYDISINHDSVVIEMTFTSPTCPMMEDILSQVKSNVESVVNGKTVEVKLVWEPAWDLSRMSDAARLELDLTEQGVVVMSYADIKNALAIIENPVDKLEFVMDLGKTLDAVPADAKCTEIFGCASFVQICEKDGHFYGRADSLMVRGIVAIILAMVAGKSIKEIKQTDLLGEFNSLNLNFGAGRLNGIQSMISFFKNL